MKQQACFVYMATSPSGRSYIGVSVDPARRWRAHLQAASKGSDLAIHRAIRKHGADSFKHQIVFESRGANSQAICFRAEKTLIEFHDTLFPNGYNLLKGGDTGSGYSRATSEKHRSRIIKALSDPAVRMKMSKVASDRLADPKERERISGSLRSYYSQHPEALEKMSRAKRAAFDHDHQRRMTEAAAKAMQDPVEAARRSECARRNATNPEVRAKMRAALAKKVQCVETGQCFGAIADAVRWLHSEGMLTAQKSKICQAAKGKTELAYGYRWRYLNCE